MLAVLTPLTTEIIVFEVRSWTVCPVKNFDGAAYQRAVDGCLETVTESTEAGAV